MQPINKVRAALRAGRKPHGFRLTVPSPANVEILSVTPIARVPDLTGPTVDRRLGRGVRGIIGWHVSTMPGGDR